MEVPVYKRSNLNERTVAFDNTSRPFWPERRRNLTIIESVGQNQYDGLQVSLRKRFSNRVQYVVHYTLSRLVGNVLMLAECRACIGDERDVGPLNNDTTHRLVLSGVFQLPWDFQVSALFQGENGRPLTADRINWGRNFTETVESQNFGKPKGELWTNQLQIQLGVRLIL